MKKRGTIIVDNSVLAYLVKESGCPFLSAEAKGGDTSARYFDALIFLSKHGYDVIIPSLVAYEASRMMPSGKRISEYFPGGHEADIFVRAHECLLPIKKKRVPGISIVTPPAIHPYSDADTYMHKAQLAEEIAQKTGLRKALQDFQHLETKDLGETAAIDWVKRLKVSDSAKEAPIFFLCNDHLAMEKFIDAIQEKGLRGGRLNIRGFFSALERHDLFPHIGFKQGDKPCEIIDGIYRHDPVHARDVHNIVYIDSSTYNITSSDLPFQYSLFGVKEEIEAEKAAPARPLISEIPPPPALSAIEKFKARCAKTQALNHKTTAR